MEKRPLVVLLGDSLLMDGVAVSLAGRPKLRMVRMDPDVTDIGECLESLKPDLIVFELDNPRSPMIFSILREHPGILLIGLDPDSSQAIVLNSQQHITETMNDLAEIVQVETGQMDGAAKGGGPAGTNGKMGILT
jgi:hypothetical protein